MGILEKTFMDNGTSEILIRQFDRIAMLPDTWDHNRHYHDFLLRFVPENCESGLDLGCGIGVLTRRLAERCRKVTGIDVSAEMIRVARERNGTTRIAFTLASAKDHLSRESDAYEVIISAATLHHLDLDGTFKKVKRALKPKGLFIVLDLYKERSLYEKILSLVSLTLNPLLHLLHRKRFSPTEKEKKEWREHSRYDHYNTLEEIKASSRRHLGDAVIQRHLFWRYSLRYTKE
ncbi:MAG: class I SAM-dependent methyltransferase [Spirochaetes bacterium]|nr:class I SAM-dependent methyltransferase [Spirochaetota bacterium]